VTRMYWHLPLMGNESDALLSVHALTGSDTTPDDADPAPFVSLHALPGNVSTATARNHSLPGNGRAHRGSLSGIRPQTLGGVGRRATPRSREEPP
jgi:hypothetical protein